MITYKYSKVCFQKSAGTASTQASVSHMTWVLALTQILCKSSQCPFLPAKPTTTILNQSLLRANPVSLELLPSASLYQSLLRLQKPACFSQLPVPCPPLTHGVSFF